MNTNTLTAAWLRLVLTLGAALLLATQWTGCANTSRASDQAALDHPTEMDETPARKRAKVRLQLAVNYFSEDKTDVALDEVKRALVQDPDYADALNLRGLIYLRLREFGGSEDSFRRALALKPGNGEILHNLGWMQCQQRRYAEADANFAQALSNNLYRDRAKTQMARGMCQEAAGKLDEAEHSLAHAFELDAANPIVSYNLARLIYQRGDYQRAQFYIRRLNNSELANAQSLWLGIKVERKLGNIETGMQLHDQLQKRFAASKELQLYEKGLFDD